MSNLKQSLKRQIDHSGNLLLKCSSVLTDEEFFYKPEIGASMAWTLGHLAALQDWAVQRVFLSEKPEFSRDKRDALKGGREVTEEDLQFISDRPEVERTFARVQFNTIAELHQFDEKRWNEATPSGCRFPTLGTLWEHLSSHNFWHLGMLSASIPRLATLTLIAPHFYTVDHDEPSR